MIDTSKIRKYTTENEDYAIKWFNEHGFNGKVLHQWTTETSFEVEKDGITDTFRLTYTHRNPKKCIIEEYMKQFEKSFEMKVQIEKMKAELDNRLASNKVSPGYSR